MRLSHITGILTPRGFCAGLLLVALVGAASLCTPYPARLVQALRRQPPPRVQVVEKIVEVPVEVRVEVPVPAAAPEVGQDVPAQPWQPPRLMPMPEIQLPPFPPALPEKVEVGAFEHFSSLSRGLNLHSTLTFHKGSTASQDRKKKNAWLVKMSMELLLPHAANGQELLHANPHLPKVLARYAEVMAQARVSRWFHALYLHKQNHVRKNMTSLSQPLDRHNFFDTDTILEITAPSSHRRVLWMQADMDVVSDGSDGDRLPTMPEAIRKSDHYQPTTSYRWKKLTKNPNPLLPRWESRLAKLLAEKPRNAAAIDYARRTIVDLKKYSYLLAQYDPFIVIPLTFKEGSNDAFRPQPGDYAAVIVDKRVFPAIVGDYGPKYKAGEASLRLGKLVNPKADIYARPVSSLEASYVIFPHTAEAEAGPIDYERLNARCQELLQEIGGLAEDAEYVPIEDLLAPKPPPMMKDDADKQVETPEETDGQEPAADAPAADAEPAPPAETQS